MKKMKNNILNINNVDLKYIDPFNSNKIKVRSLLSSH